VRGLLQRRTMIAYDVSPLGRYERDEGVRPTTENTSVLDERPQPAEGVVPLL
jgi:hypothetical protein